MNSYRKTAIIGSASAVTLMLAVGGTAFAITKILMDIALNHEPPAILAAARNMISGSEKTKTFLDEITRTQNILLSMDTEEVETEAYDGTLLKAHILSTERPERIIIAFHGWRSSWSRDFGMISRFWNESGATVIYVEQRGQNGSSFEYMGFGEIERLDCNAWAEYVCRRYEENLPIYLAGISMGAATVLMSANLHMPDRVHGIMADCGFTSAKSIWSHVVQNNLHLSYNRSLRSLVADMICRKKTGYGANEVNTLEVLKEARVPVLFIHGADDRFVPVEMTYDNYASCSTPKKLHIVEGADHGMSYFVDKCGYENAMRRFWEEFD